jgi:peptide/nickel transport system ATP-binding protein
MYVGQIVEEGPTDRIFAAPEHPYTQGLLAAIPSSDPARRSITARVEGDVPSSANPPAGCRFHPRCPQAFERCRHESPPVVQVGAGSSRCFLSEPAQR